jgi:hypothetical protein
MALDGSTVTSLSFGRGINDAGQIAFEATLADGRTGIYRADLQTVPEPSSLLLGCLGGASVLGFGRRASKKRPARA